MLLDMNYKVTIGSYELTMLADCEIHKSVDLLAATCSIMLPDAAYNHVLSVQDKIKRGDKVKVELGYNGDPQTEFEGYLRTILTDDNTITLMCEDALFLLRKPVADKVFAKSTVHDIASYIVKDAGVAMAVDSRTGISYDKFVINNATAYDVLKKLQEETKANIFIVEREGKTTLCLYPPYLVTTGNVVYSYQHNIESADLKYVREEDKRVEIVVKQNKEDGTVKEVKYGVTGGDQIYVEVNGMSESSLQELAKSEYLLQSFDGFDGSITGWLIPYCEPTYVAQIEDREYPEKTGKYYVKSTTVTFNEAGGKRKVDLGKRVA